MTKYNSIILKDDKNNVYLGTVEDSTLTGFKKLSVNDPKLFKDILDIELHEFLIVEVLQDDKTLQITPLTCGSLSCSDNEETVPLFSLDHDKLLNIFNTMIPENYK